MLLNERELSKIVMDIMQGKGLILPKCDNVEVYNDMINQVSKYIETL